MIKQDISSSTLCLKSSTTRAPVCDTCRSTPSTIYCQPDLAYLCTACDSQLHAANKLSSTHKRVRLCEACEQAPAAFVCKADAASLCASCDVVIHSANPLSRRHHRVPVMPVSGSVVYGHRAAEPWSTVTGPGVESGGGFTFLSQESEGTVENEEEDEAASWLVFDSSPKNSQSQNDETTNGFLRKGDEYLDLVEFNSCQDTNFSDDFQFEDEYKYINDNTNNNSNQQQRYGGCDADSVVPVHCGEVKKYHQLHHDHNFHNQKFQLGMDYETSNGGYGYPASLGHSVSMSSSEAGTVPDSTITEADASISNARNPKSTIDLFSRATQLPSIDREARVLRYREKKKTRKFEKTIRYASRKAYAEKRPRIKGRFAKRTTNVDIEVDQILSPKLVIEAGYYIFPSS